LQAVYRVRQQQFLEMKAQKEQQEHLTRALELRKQLESLPETSSSVQRYLLKVQVQEASERAQQVVRELQIRHIDEQINDGYKIIEQKTADVYQKLGNLQELVNMVDKLALETKQIQEILQNKIQVFEQQRTVVKKRGESLARELAEYNEKTQQLLEKVVNLLQQEANSLPPLLGKGKDLLALLEVAYKETLQQALFRLRKLPSDIAGWSALFKEEIALIPYLFVQQAQLSWQGVVQAVQQTTMKNWLIIIAVSIGWLVGLLRLIRWTKSHTLDAHSPSFIGQSFFLGLHLLQHNVISILLMGILLILIWFTNPTAASTIFILTLVLGWLSIVLVSGLLKLLLLNEDIKHLITPAMRWQLQGIVVIIGILTIITMLVHIKQDGYILEVSLTASDMIDTVFMVLLSLLILPLIRIRQLILNIWKNDISGYNSLMMTLITLLIPMIILTTSVLGLIGYISLGWSFAKHLSLFLMVFVTTFILEGLTTDVMNVWRRNISKETNYGLLWADSIVPLIHKLLSLGVLALGIVIFLWVTGWYSDVAMRKTIASIFNYALFNIGSNPITISNILLAAFILWLMFWLGGWSRQVTYQFIYQNIVDLGVRQSLSVFTQYTVIFIGVLVAMSIIGINLTTLTVFAGAIGVGIGFGLRDLINNFISGILLLVERPLRNGDFIEVGANQGRVKQIGIRSLMIRAIDGRDIVVPNSEVISRTFVNWTLTDKLRRTTITVNLNYRESPHLAKEVLLKITEALPEILRTPAPSVLLSDFTDYSMKISLNYFIDMSQAIAPIVKSKVLFLIWERFAEAGIQIPYPQQDIHLKADALEHPLLKIED
jgi:potassium efflux system protein